MPHQHYYLSNKELHYFNGVEEFIECTLITSLLLMDIWVAYHFFPVIGNEVIRIPVYPLVFMQLSIWDKFLQMEIVWSKYIFWGCFYVNVGYQTSLW